MVRAIYRSETAIREGLVAGRHRQAMTLIAERTDPENPPSDKQVTYLADLLSVASNSPLVDIGEGPLTKKRAQELITQLTGPRKGRR